MHNEFKKSNIASLTEKIAQGTVYIDKLVTFSFVSLILNGLIFVATNDRILSLPTVQLHVRVTRYVRKYYAWLESNWALWPELWHLIWQTQLVKDVMEFFICMMLAYCA